MNASSTDTSPLTLLDRRAYFDDSIHKEEIEKIYFSRFQFAGLTSELSKHRDFVTLNMPGLSAVVQNFNGQLRAFHNICSHRFNLIQWEPRGNRPLTCRYHAWSYDAEGNPLGDKSCRMISANSTDETLRLKKLRLEVCGMFVFVALEDVNHSLREQLGEFYDVLEQLSMHIGKEMYFNHVPHAANWKLLVENVIECLHCGVVHPTTFVKKLGVGRIPLEQVLFSNDSSSGHTPAANTENKDNRLKYLAHLDRRIFKHKSFYHIHIMPNLFIASAEGLSFYIGHAVPTTANSTLLAVRYFEPAIDYSEHERMLQDVINEQTIKLGLQVLDEDRTILERVQQGIELTDKHGALDKEEVRIAHFMRSYKHLMGC